MATQTKKQRSEAAKKAAQTRKRNAAQTRKRNAAQESSDKARLEGSTGATRSSTAAKTKDQRIIDALKRPSQPHVDQELALTDVEHFLRDNPGARAPDNSRRVLPVEEFPKNDPVRKAHDKAQKVIDDTLDSLDKDASVDPVLAGKIKLARRTLRS